MAYIEGTGLRFAEAGAAADVRFSDAEDARGGTGYAGRAGSEG